ncbi:mycothiol synthase [Jatrophihabitans sp. YIM 134969]
MIRTRDRLDTADARRLTTAPDLSDEARVRLQGATDGIVHLLADDGSYAQLDTHDGALELVATDESTVTELVQQATVEQGGDVLVWTHADDDAIARAVRNLDATEERVLWRLRRPDVDLPPARPFPEGVTVRAFEVGRDEEAWLVVNAAAFASHPEQGRMTLADLAAREADDWFDPAGFLLAERAGELQGFHWTKVHRDEDPAVGEVYVLGVAPEAQGTGLGGALLDAGLEHLRRQGLGVTVLYVDDDNPGAVALYERIGFQRDHRDTRHRVRPAARA